MADKTARREKPLLRIRSHFVPLLVFYHHPVRLTVSLAIPAMLLPELRGLLQALSGLSEKEAQLAAVFGIIFLVFLPQLLGSAIACRKVKYDFYADRLEYNEYYMLAEVTRLPYKQVTGVRIAAGAFQRLFGVADIVITLQGRSTGKARRPPEIRQVIRDVRHAADAVGRLQKIFSEWETAQARPEAQAPTAPAGILPRP